jgi:hypothetical protein
MKKGILIHYLLLKTEILNSLGLVNIPPAYTAGQEYFVNTIYSNRPLKSLDLINVPLPTIYCSGGIHSPTAISFYEINTPPDRSSVARWQKL